MMHGMGGIRSIARSLGVAKQARRHRSVAGSTLPRAEATFAGLRTWSECVSGERPIRATVSGEHLDVRYKTSCLPKLLINKGMRVLLLTFKPFWPNRYKISTRCNPLY